MSKILHKIIEDISRVELEKKLEEFDEMMQERESSKEMAAGSLPNKKRKEFKKTYSTLIEEYESYKEAVKLYESLIT